MTNLGMLPAQALCGVDQAQWTAVIAGLLRSRILNCPEACQTCQKFESADLLGTSRLRLPACGRYGKLSTMLDYHGRVIFDCKVEKHEHCFPMIPSGKPHSEILPSDVDTAGAIGTKGAVLV